MLFISEEVESVFHFHSGLRQQEEWNVIAGFLWLSETFSKNFSEITLDRHLDLKLYELYIFWMLIWSIILLFFCSFATEIKIPNLYFEKL